MFKQFSLFSKNCVQGSGDVNNMGNPPKDLGHPVLNYAAAQGRREADALVLEVSLEILKSLIARNDSNFKILDAASYSVRGARKLIEEVKSSAGTS